MGRILRILEKNQQPRKNNHQRTPRRRRSDRVPRDDRTDYPNDDPAAEADALVRVIRDRLPDRLRVQLSTATLRTRAQALASVGWTERALAVAVADRVWNGAHGGAVITWLTDLAVRGSTAHHGEPRFPNNDSPATRRSRSGEIRCGRTGLAGREQARQLAAQFGRRRS